MASKWYFFLAREPYKVYMPIKSFSSSGHPGEMYVGPGLLTFAYPPPGWPRVNFVPYCKTTILARLGEEMTTFAHGKTRVIS
jgi:hypothetical protein